MVSGTPQATTLYGLDVRTLVAALVLSLLTLAAPAPAGAGEPVSPVNVEPPTVAGHAVYDAKLRARPGTWEPEPASVAYRWLRDGDPVGGADERDYRVRLGDIGHRLAVRVRVTDAEGGTAEATSTSTDRVVRATFKNRRSPRVAGARRFTHTLVARPGRWSTRPSRVNYRWLRSGKPIRGATHARYILAPQDVGRHVRVRVRVFADGYERGQRASTPGPLVRHRVDVRHRVTYSLITRGQITTSVPTFASQAQQTYDDARGWRGSGISFRRVPSGGSFTLVLAAASEMTSFSSACSPQYSCRVGRYVIINQDRWKYATRPWRLANGGLRDYRHMVVNHETGHWFGLGHATCPGAGRPAPVMQQQSKGLDGCRFNPFPTLGEQMSRTPGSGRSMVFGGRPGDARFPSS